MKRLIFYFLILIASIWLGIKIYQNPGYMLIYYQQWAVETTMWFLILVLMLVFFILSILFYLIKGIVRFPAHINAWWQVHSTHKAIRLLNKGYVNFLKGNYRLAEKKLTKSAKNKNLAFVNYMMAAKIAQIQKISTKKRDHYLALAKQQNKKESYLAETRHAKFLLEDKQVESALTKVIKLKAERPKDPQIIKLQALCYIELGEWQHLQKILTELKKFNVFDRNAFLEIERETYLHALSDRLFGDFSEIQRIWNGVPAYLKKDVNILIAYAVHLVRWNREQEAEGLVRKALKKNDNARLMEYYATLGASNPVKQVALGEKYLKNHQEDAVSLRAMGLLCMRNRLWGQAKDYLEKSLNLAACPKAYSALGLVHEKLGEDEKALYFYRKGLQDLFAE